MKLRLRHNSIRLRLLQSEIKELAATGEASETIVFAPDQKLIYRLKISATANRISVCFENDRIVVEIPEKAARDWLETDSVGLENEQRIDDETSLKILIEKDFVCTTRPLDADNADAFPHPKTDCS